MLPTEVRKEGDITVTSYGCDKTLQQQQLQEGRVSLAHSSIVVGRIQGQEHEAAGPIAFKVR